MLGMVLGTQAVQSPRCVGCLVGLCRGFPPFQPQFSIYQGKKGLFATRRLAGEGSVLQEGKRAQCSSCTEQAEGRFGAAWGGRSHSCGEEGLRHPCFCV